LLPYLIIFRRIVIILAFLLFVCSQMTIFAAMMLLVCFYVSAIELKKEYIFCLTI